MKNRSILFVTLGLGLASLLSAASVAAEIAPATPAAPTYTLQSGRQVGQTDRVVVLLEVAGDCVKKAAQTPAAPMNGVAHLVYAEKTLETAATPEGHARAIRSYERADAVIRAGKEGNKPSLAQSAA